jgi:Family of unknown function (DUF6318)
VRDLRVVVVGLVLGTTLLTGCAEKVEANDTLPSTSATPTTEALPPVGPADFPVPDEARSNDAAGAEAFARYWIDLLNHQRMIPAGQPLRDLGPDCQECQRIAQNYDEAAAAGNRYVGGELSLNDMPPAVVDGADASVNFTARREPVSIIGGNGTTLEARPEPAPNLSSGISLTWSPADRSWIVTGFTLG